MKSDTIRIAIEVVIATIVVSLILPGVISMGAPSGSTSVQADTTGFTTVADTVSVPGQIDVSSTKGNALYFDESDSVDISGPANLTNGSWSVLVSANLNQATTPNATYDLYAYDNESIVVQLDQGDWVAYYDNGTHSALARVDAAGQASTDRFDSIAVRFNDSTDTITLAREATDWDSDTLDTSVEPRNSSIGWNGTIEELRNFESPISNSTISAYADDPIQPLPDTTRAARLMFDEGSGSDTQVYFDGSVASINGAQWTQGIHGPATGGFFDGLVGDTLQEGQDFELADEEFAIKYVEGGYLDGAPVVFVQWSARDLVTLLLGFIPVMAGILVLVTVVDRIENIL